ncbi:WD40 repeat domain-containing protein [Armatimonas sp.]|uniref:WD40 repeat domain-containing protein n=1 Tax=Armatimonas sp. TaxID=1872638 RepID=UPI0037534B5F
MRLKHTPSQTTTPPPTSYSTTAPAPITTSSTATVATAQQSTPVARSVAGIGRGHRKTGVARVALWVVGLVPVVASGLVLKPRLEAQQVLRNTQLHQERAASGKEPLAFLPVAPGFVANGMSFSLGERYAAIRSYKEKPSFQGRDVIWTNQTTTVDLLSGKRLSVTQNPPTGLSWAVALSEDGKTFVTTEYGDFKKKQRLLIWWDSATGKAIRKVNFPGYGQEVVFSQGAKELLIAQHGRLELIDPRTGRLLSELPLPKQIGGARTETNAHQLALSPNGQWIAGRVPLQSALGRYAEAGAGIVLWKRGEKASRWSFPVREHGSPNTISVTNEGTVVASVERITKEIGWDEIHNRGVVCLEADSGKPRWFLSNREAVNDQVSALAFETQQGWFAVRRWEKTIELRRLTDASLIKEMDMGKPSSNSGSFAQKLRFSSDGKKLYDRQSDGIAVWSLEGLK